MVPRVALPPKARAVVYYVFAIGGLGLGATQVGYLAAEVGQPVWLTVALAVFGFLGVGFGLTAASNTPTGLPPNSSVYITMPEGTTLNADARDEVIRAIRRADVGRASDEGGTRRDDLDPPGGAL